MNAAQLLHGDCLDHMARLPDASVHLILCDLPYGGSKTGFGWDCRIDLDAFWREVRRVLHPKGVVVAFATQPFTSDLIASNRAWFRYCLVWQKSRPTGHPHCWARPLAEHEDIVVFTPGNAASGRQNDAKRSTYNPQGLVSLLRPRQREAAKSKYLGKWTGWAGGVQKWTNFPRSVLRFASVHKPLHGTQKPTDLLRYLIRTYSNAGDTVLDPTMGSGSTGEAALQEGRHFVGIELTEKFFDIASERTLELERMRKAA